MTEDLISVGVPFTFLGGCFVTLSFARSALILT